MNYGFFKRALDIIISVKLCILLLPVFIVIMSAICIESPGNPIFVQYRIGRGGRPYRIYKFRSMVKDASALGTVQTAQNDTRITRVGKILRATSLDELPQLWNVLIGDMSLIGPRPEVASRQSAQNAEDAKLRVQVRPGITGLAQVSGRSSLSDEEQLRHDLSYAANPSFKADIDILCKTVKIVLHRVGVN